MTRDEAIKTLMKYQGDHDPERTERWIDAFESLGILKLDEPMSGFLKFKKNMVAVGYSENSNIWPDISIALNNSNLKIVEK